MDDADRYAARDGRRAAAPSDPRPRSQTRNFNERPPSPSRARSDSRSGPRDEDYSRNSHPRGSDPRNGHDDGRRGNDDGRRGYDQRENADAYDAGRDRSRNSTRSFREDERSGSADERPRSRSSTRSFREDERSGYADGRPRSPNSGPRDDRHGSGYDARSSGRGYDDGRDGGRGASRPGRGSSSDDWGGRGGRSSRGSSAGAGAPWGDPAEPLWPAEDEPTWDTWSNKGPKARRGHGAMRAEPGKPSGGLGGIARLWHRFGTTRFRKVAIVFVLVTLLLCAFSSVLAGLAGATAGIPAMVQTYQGYQHLKNGETLLKSLTKGSLSVSTMKQAQAEFAASQQDFTQAHANLARLPGFDYSAPIVGRQLPLALQLTALAANFSQMGADACDAGTLVIGAVANPFGGSLGGSSSAKATPGPTPTPTATPSPVFTPVTPAPNGLTPADMETIQGKLASVSTLLNASTAQINALNPSDFSFDAKIASEFGKLKAALPQIKQYLSLAMTILPVAAPLLGVGTPAKYLVELLDSTELRPGGGFIGNYGVLVLSGGVLSSLHVTDVDLIDRPFEKNGGPGGTPGCIQPPVNYSWFSDVVVPCWSLRDSNLSANFPTSATYGQKNYHQEGGQDTFQGVITITPWLIEKLIAITGPVTVPEFADPNDNTLKAPAVVTSTNLPNMIHYFQLNPNHKPDTKAAKGTTTSERKVFTADLFAHFMAQIKAKLKTDKTVFVKAALDALATKDVQIYFNNPQAQALLAKYNFTSTILSPKTGDSLMVVDANIIANKANNFFTYTMDDQVSIDQYGTATHHLTLTYNWPQSAAYEQNAYGSHGSKWQYQAYVRVYVPPQAQLLNTTGWWYYLGTQPAYGRQVYTGYIRMSYLSPNTALATPTYPFPDGPFPNTVTVTLDYAIPNAATHKGNVWTYQYLIQHQAGHAPYALWNVTETVTPSCGKVTSVTAPWQMASGGKSATLKEGLSIDKSYTMTYTCAG